MSLRNPIRGSGRRAERSSTYFNGITTDNNVQLQQILNDIASKNASKGQREFVIDSRLNFGKLVVPPDNFSLYFEKNGIIIPQADTVIGLKIDNNVDGISTMHALEADASKGDSKIDMGARHSNFSVGDYIFIKDTVAITTSPNKNNLKQSQTATVLAKDGNNLVLSRMVDYDYAAATTTVGVVGGKHNFTLEGFNFGEMGNQIGNDGCDLRYVDNLIIRDFSARNSRLATNYLPESNRQNVHGLNIVGCSNVEIHGFKGFSLGYYGISIDSCSYNVTVRGFEGSYMRHGISINWNGHGETLHYNIDDVQGSNMQLGVVDTHDVGNYGSISNVSAMNCLEDGGQVRTSNVLVRNYKAKFCGKNGFTVRHETTGDSSKLRNVRLENMYCDDNKKRGIFASVPISVSGGTCMRNGTLLDGSNVEDLVSGTIKPDETGGIATNGGLIENMAIKDNYGCAIMYHDGTSTTLKSNQEKLTVSNVDAPYNASNQTHFLRSADTYDGESLRLRDIDAVGYPVANRITRSTSTYYAEIDDTGCRWSTDTIEGTINLVAGTATVTNANVYKDGSVSTNEWFSQIALNIMEVSAETGSLSYDIVNGTSFTITSSNALSTDRVSWKLI